MEAVDKGNKQDVCVRSGGWVFRSRGAKVSIFGEGMMSENK